MKKTKQIATNRYGNRVIASVVALLLLLGLVPLYVLAEGYTKQGDDLKVHMVDPGANYISTSRLENGDYLNEIAVGYDSSVPVVFTIDIGDGDGTNHLDTAMFKDYVKVFTSETLSDDSLLYSYGTDAELTMTDVGVQTTLQRGRKFEVSVSNLDKGKDYYLAFLSGLEYVPRESKLGDNNIIFKFSTLDDATKVNLVSLDQNGVILEGIGQTIELKATVLPASATNKSIQWSSSDSTVASVDATGTVTARKAGTATITVTTVDGGKTASCPFTVREAASSDVLTKASETQILKSGAKFTIDDPVVYLSAKTGNYVIPNEVELTALPNIHITMIPNGGRKSTIFNPHVFADDTLTEEVAKSGNGITADIPDYTAATFTIDSVKLEAGKIYYFTLDKRSTCGSVPLGQDVIIEFTVKAGEPDDPTPSEPLAVTAFTSSEGTSLTEKTDTALTATATGGKAPYTYKFIVYNNQTNEWYRIRDFEPSDSCTWFTGGAGTKTLYVDVKDSEGTVVRKELGVTVSADTTEPLTVTAFQSSKGTALTEKTETTLRATATGGKSPYTYKFIVYNTQTNQWFRIQDFESVSTCTWYTGAAGTKVLYVDVKDSAGTVVRKELNVTVSANTSPLAASYFTSSKGNTLNSGDTTTLMAKATGGSGSGYRYKFIVYNPKTNQWYKIQDYSASSTASWYTGAAGTKTLYVDITDSAGNYVRTPLNVTVK